MLNECHYFFKGNYFPHFAARGKNAFGDTVFIWSFIKFNSHVYMFIKIMPLEYSNIYSLS